MLIIWLENSNWVGNLIIHKLNKLNHLFSKFMYCDTLKGSTKIGNRYHINVMQCARRTLTLFPRQYRILSNFIRNNVID